MINEFEIVSHSYLKHVNCFLVDIDYRTPHRHSDIELNLLIEGSIALTTSRSIVHSGKGDLLLFNSNQPHEIRSQGGRALILCLQISPKFFSEPRSYFSNLYFDALRISEIVSQDRLNLYRTLIIEFAYQYYSGKPANFLTCNAILYILMRLLITDIPYHTITDEEIKKTMQKTARLNRILSFMEENYMHKLLLSDIAERENLTTTYLSHFFKENLNLTFQEYLNTLRLNHAKILVATTEKRLIDICIECGFSDYRYLYKAFKESFGCTPYEYRKRYSGNADLSRSASIFSNEVFLYEKEAIKHLTDQREKAKPILRDSGRLLFGQ